MTDDECFQVDGIIYDPQAQDFPRPVYRPMFEVLLDHECETLYEDPEKCAWEDLDVPC